MDFFIDTLHGNRIIQVKLFQEPAMSSKDPERVTILAREFTAAALEFHRGKMAEKGYRMEGSITPRSFKMIEGAAPPKDLFEGDPLFAVTFVKRDSLP
jgi:hypothetical protein